jgi:3-methyladenine DNA glycosylase AlkD
MAPMPIDLPATVAELERDLRAVATPERAAQEKRYLKSDLEFLGASYWETGRLVKAFAARNRRLGRDELLGLVEALWSRPVFELRSTAVNLLDRFGLLLAAGDLPLVERLLRESGTWALVDDLAVHVVGRLVGADPAACEATLDRWAADADFWVRRASLLGELLPLRGEAPFARVARRADGMLEEREFFIRKAIGWVLRDVGKRNPDVVVAWLEPRIGRASGVTVREAVKYLPLDAARRLTAAYRGSPRSRSRPRSPDTG